MGLLVSCCLRLMGYENVGGVASAQRNHHLSTILAERDNPNVDGRKRAMSSKQDTTRLDNFGRTETGSADVALSGELGPPLARGWPSVSDQQSDSPPSSMPRGYREDGTSFKPKPSLVDTFRRH